MTLSISIILINLRSYLATILLTVHFSEHRSWNTLSGEWEWVDDINNGHCRLPSRIVCYCGLYECWKCKVGLLGLFPAALSCPPFSLHQSSVFLPGSGTDCSGFCPPSLEKLVYLWCRVGEKAEECGTSPATFASERRSAAFCMQAGLA